MEQFYKMINLKKFIIHNQQTELDKKLQNEIIDILSLNFKDDPNIIITYMENHIYPLKMKLMINIYSKKFTDSDVIKYKNILTENDLDKMNLIKEFIKDKIYKHLNIE